MSGYFYVIGGANYEKKESYCIDLDILKETKKKNPKVLLIAAAINDDSKKINTFIDYYNSLGAVVNTLYTYGVKLDESLIEEAITNTDIIYLAGGLTYRLVELFNKCSLKDKLLRAYHNGKIIAGVSAGAIVLFEYGFGDKDAFMYNLETINHQFTDGCGLLNGVFCPHYQNSGLLVFNTEITKFNLNGFALENGAGLKIDNNGFMVIKEKGSSAFMFDFSLNHQLIYLKENTLYSLDLIK